MLLDVSSKKMYLPKEIFNTKFESTQKGNALIPKISPQRNEKIFYSDYTLKKLYF